MANCTDCVHVEVCKFKDLPAPLSDSYIRESECIEKRCGNFKDHSRFVELKSAEWIEDAERFRIPMKATIKSESFKGRQLSVGYFCQKCHKPVFIHHLHCYECGQAIDWGDCP